MKIVYKDIDKNGAGTITVITESLEDMWHAYNLITAGDRVRASTFRKVAKETATGSTEKERKRITVTIEVKAIDFDANSGIIRLNGQNVEENQFIKVCSYLFGLDLEKIKYLINNIIRTKQCDNSIVHYCRTCIIGALLPQILALLHNSIFALNSQMCPHFFANESPPSHPRQARSNRWTSIKDTSSRSSKISGTPCRWRD